MVDPNRSGKKVRYVYSTVTFNASPGWDDVAELQLHEPTVLIATHLVVTVRAEPLNPDATFFAAPAATPGIGRAIADGDGRSSTLSGRIDDGHPRVEQESEVEDPRQDEQEDRQDERELDHRLTARAVSAAGPAIQVRRHVLAPDQRCGLRTS